MDYDVKLLIESSIESVAEIGELLYWIDKTEGLSADELERLIGILTKIE
ncbi:hypothetical protein [Oceanobacillus oncorhynchi]